jgi:hypothetical protein
MKAAARRQRAAQEATPAVTIRADGGDFRRESAARSRAEGEPQPASSRSATSDVAPAGADQKDANQASEAPAVDAKVASSRSAKRAAKSSKK